jgi:hypothetical protein
MKKKDPATNPTFLILDIPAPDKNHEEIPTQAGKPTGEFKKYLHVIGNRP